MDYRAIALERVKFINGKACYGGGGKVRCQTPPARVESIGPVPKFGPHAVGMTLTFRSAGFRAWMEGLAALAAEDPVTKGLRMMELTRWDGCLEMRVTTFGETLWFDPAGKHLDAPSMSMSACACLIDVQGVWVSRGSGTWGVKWRVLECKEGVTTTDDGFAFRDVAASSYVGGDEGEDASGCGSDDGGTHPVEPVRWEWR